MAGDCESSVQRRWEGLLSADKGCWAQTKQDQQRASSDESRERCGWGPALGERRRIQARQGQRHINATVLAVVTGSVVRRPVFSLCARRRSIAINGGMGITETSVEGSRSRIWRLAACTSTINASVAIKEDCFVSRSGRADVLARVVSNPWS